MHSRLRPVSCDGMHTHNIQINTHCSWSVLNCFPFHFISFTFYCVRIRDHDDEDHEKQQQSAISLNRYSMPPNECNERKKWSRWRRRRRRRNRKRTGDGWPCISKINSLPAYPFHILFPILVLFCNSSSVSDVRWFLLFVFKMQLIAFGDCQKEVRINWGEIGQSSVDKQFNSMRTMHRCASIGRRLQQNYCVPYRSDFTHQSNVDLYAKCFHFVIFDEFRTLRQFMCACDEWMVCTCSHVWSHERSLGSLFGLSFF